MRISRIKLLQFRRFSDLEIRDIPETARLVVMAGPNGCGKSSLFDAFNTYYQRNAGFGCNNDKNYYSKGADLELDMDRQVIVDAHSGKSLRERGSLYIRTAYRNDPDFALSSLNRQGPVIDEQRVHRMIEGDAAVSKNYQRLASQAFEDLFSIEPEGTTVGEFRERVIGEIRDAMNRLFPDLMLNNLGNPLDRGPFRFDKGRSKEFEYKNLSGGEKAAFDLILDIFVKRRSFSDAIYCIDEPDAHMNTRLQGRLLEELYNSTPADSQLWVSTHSIGMMRKARELDTQQPGSVAFLDFDGYDFDQPTVITPTRPTRAFWERVLNVALDDLASLVAPREVVICEGNPVSPIAGRNAAHDAQIYNTIFSEHLPDLMFLAGGNSKEVATDRLAFVAALPLVASGIKVRRLIDRDDHAPQDIIRMTSEGITTLGRRHLEAYLYDDEVLTALCTSVGLPDRATDLLEDKNKALAESVSRGNPADDLKSAAGVIYTKAKSRLGLIGAGNDQMAFARNTLAPLIKPGMNVYSELKSSIFGI